MTNLKQTRPQYGDSIATVDGENVIFNDYMNKFIDDILATQLPETSASYYSASNQNITAATTTIVVFGTKEWDDGGNFASNEYTVPDTRRYVLSAQATFAVNADSDRVLMFVYVDGVSVYQSSQDVGGNAEHSVSICKEFEFTQGEDVDIRVQNVNNSDTINSGADLTYFQIRPI